jgi:hypothetical protein
MELSRDEKNQNIRTLYVAVIGELNNYRNSMLHIVATASTLYIAIFAWYLSQAGNGINFNISFIMGYLFLTILSWEILIMLKKYIRQVLTVINKCEDFMLLFECNIYLPSPILPIEWKDTGHDKSVWTESYLRMYRSVSIISFFAFLFLLLYKNYTSVQMYFGAFGW